MTTKSPNQTPTVRFLDCDCTVQKLHYPNGRVALQLVDAGNGEPVATATVNVPGLVAGPNQIFVKDYSENEGMLKALTDAGVVKDTGIRVESGFASIPVAELLQPFRELTHEETLEKASARSNAREDRGQER